MNTFIYDRINTLILERLSNGNIIWKKGWRGRKPPMNFKTRYPYRGINVFLLSSLGYTSPYFLSFKQVKSYGGSVKKGEKSCPVIFWKMFEKVERDQEKGTIQRKDIPVLRYYNVFNYDQCTGLPKVEEEKELKFSPIEEAERIITGYNNGPSISHGGNQAYYSPLTDSVTMPEKKQFASVEEYYSTLFHELTHSTGHETRLNRFDKKEQYSFRSDSYSKEELTAELGAAYLSAIAGIETTLIDNQAAYIASWMKALKDDKTLFISAGAKAQKAVDLILQVEKKG